MNDEIIHNNVLIVNHHLTHYNGYPDTPITNLDRIMKMSQMTVQNKSYKDMIQLIIRIRKC